MKNLITTIKLSLIGILSLVGLNMAFVGTASAQLAGMPLQSNSSQVADINQSKNAACKGIGLAGGSCQGGGNGINKVLKTVLNLLSAIAGLIAVIMIIVSGIKFTTSGGDSQKVASAKSALVYAIVGLVVVALSQIIVHFVISTV